MQSIRVCNTKFFAWRAFSSVFDVDQVQAPGRQRGSCQFPVAGIEDIVDFVRRQATLADFQQCSCNRPDHVLKKSASPDAEDPCRFAAIPGSVKNGACSILDLGCCRAKRREIMRTDKACS